MSGAGTALFIVSAIVAFIGAIVTVAARRPLRAAMGLLLHIIALAGLFLTVHAELLSALQLLVYAGAVVVLFVFVIMLIGPSAEVDAGTSNLPSRAVGTFAMLSVVLVVAFSTSSILMPRGVGDSSFGTVEGLGKALYVDAFVPFELVSITLLVAIVGAIAAVSRSRRNEEQNSDERIHRVGIHPLASERLAF
ncbi:MAG: NADH-quinone oxidoreductase subunit J [Polyangiales bacterium]